MGWIIGIAVVIFVIYQINKDYKSDIKSNVSSQGGMQSKYQVLIDYFTCSPSAQITKLTSSNITITTPSSTFYIDYVGGSTEVSLNIMHPTGKISKKWKFPNGYPQEKMIQDIDNYLDWEVGKRKQAMNNNFGQYIN